MRKHVSGEQVFLDGEAFYKIENFDAMDDFFMTITSSCDVWNFCWAQGGISAGRKNCDYPIFPYYTCDKIQDAKGTTGSVTIIKIKSEGKRGIIWQPFENLFSTGASRYTDALGIQRNLYKNLNGSKIWFEEINLMAGISYRYGWTSSAKYGLVKMTRVENLTDRKVILTVLDGARNIMPTSCDASIQTTKSVLLDAYKKAEVDEDSNVALFSLSSIVTDKAEPSESLTTNVSWFTTKDPVILSENAVNFFLSDKTEQLLDEPKELHGKRGECYIIHESELVGKSAECWEQVFDTDYDIFRLVALKDQIKHRDEAWKLLLEDMMQTEAKLIENIAAADGVQTSGNEIGDLHHRTNVMFNSMRGGIFADEGNIRIADFIIFARHRNKQAGTALELLLKSSSLFSQEQVSHSALKEVIFATDNPQFKRLFLEYLPLTFSRRHGDPSRPWNRFNIDLLDSNGNDKINYEGNWRDIFQNWEALVWSYPEYAEHICAVFVNTMTVEGYNPYRISRDGLDWEVPEEGNPWAQFGYWGDHQVIYLQKLLEFMAKYDKQRLISMMNEALFSTANIPYRIKTYKEILADPRNSINFDYDLDAKVREQANRLGTDARCLLRADDSLQLTTLATKLTQLILAKLLNHVPEAGIWMNTQRPEWNDANNALAGYGTSVVTMCYLHRMLSFLIRLCKESGTAFAVEKTVAQTLEKTAALYQQFYADAKNGISSKARKTFTDAIGALFEQERDVLYQTGFSDSYQQIESANFVEMLTIFADAIKNSIQANKRADGLFHAYNSLVISATDINVVNLKLMLEGQVAILSCDILTKAEKKSLTEKMRKSDLFEERQHSYMLYPNSRLPDFTEKNAIQKDDVAELELFIERSKGAVLKADMNGIYHFNALFRNADVMKSFLTTLEESQKPNETEEKLLFALYEKIFNHQSFTGRSGTFYGYEGLGCIYWHMVSKLLLAVRENITEPKDSLLPFYKDVKKGLGSSKTPAEYGAFPFDPYSHTPYGQGARQPGMTGQVKEEILTRWKELGVDIQDGQAVFMPAYLEKNELDYDGQLHFTWCGTSIVYDAKQSEPMVVAYNDGKKSVFDGTVLPQKESRLLFTRSGKITEVRISTK